MKKIILLYFICSFSIYAQGRNFLANEKTNGTSTIDSLFSSVNKQLSGYPSECIYLQTAKEFMKPVKTFGSKPISWMYKPSAYRIKVRLFICK